MRKFFGGFLGTFWKTCTKWLEKRKKNCHKFVIEFDFGSFKGMDSAFSRIRPKSLYPTADTLIGLFQLCGNSGDNEGDTRHWIRLANRTELAPPVE